MSSDSVTHLDTTFPAAAGAVRTPHSSLAALLPCVVSVPWLGNSRSFANQSLHAGGEERAAFQSRAELAQPECAVIPLLVGAEFPPG